MHCLFYLQVQRSDFWIRIWTISVSVTSNMLNTLKHYYLQNVIDFVGSYKELLYKVKTYYLQYVAELNNWESSNIKIFELLREFTRQMTLRPPRYGKKELVYNELLPFESSISLHFSSYIEYNRIDSYDRIWIKGVKFLIFQWRD